MGLTLSINLSDPDDGRRQLKGSTDGTEHHAPRMAALGCLAPAGMHHGLSGRRKGSHTPFRLERRALTPLPTRTYLTTARACCVLVVVRG